jgi:hypothetical protein
MEKEKMIKEINMVDIPTKAKIKVYWSDKPENYSRESRDSIRKYFFKKYGVQSKNINVIYRPVKIGSDGENIIIDGATIDNILNVVYQRQLFKEWFIREDKDVDFDRLMSLDKKVNLELDIDFEAKQDKNYRLKSITISNFLSYGEDNHFPVDKFSGFTVVNSTPANQGGKSILTIDTIKFLFFGKTTKTDKNEEVFNQFSASNKVYVRGVLSVGLGDDITIERLLTRRPKRNGGWNVTNKVNYYKILPNGDEEQLNDEDAKKTTQLIKEIVGTEKDFDLMVLATSRNLDDLIDSTGGESGKLLTKFIGLEIIATKERIARDMYNKFSKSMKSNIYNIKTLSEEIETNINNIESLSKTQADLTNELSVEKNLRKCLTNDKYILLSDKDKIDSEITTLNPSKLEKEIDIIISEGNKLKENIRTINKEIGVIGDVNFDEDKDFELTKLKNIYIGDTNLNESEITRVEGVISNLISSGICEACNRPLDDVDNTKHISEHKKTISAYKAQINENNKLLLDVNKQLDMLSEAKIKINSKNKLELDRDRLEVEVSSLRYEYKLKNSDLKKYKLNLKSIEKNKEIDCDISAIDTKIIICEKNEEELNNKLRDIVISMELNEKDIETKNKLISIINKEKEIEKIFKVYIEMVGKKGISKLLLRSVLPIINGELQRLLEDTTNFDVEVYIDDKNEVKYLLVKDGVEKPLKSGSGFELTASSIALRSVLGRLSSLPKPNFITFDEVLGRVAPENISKMKPLFDKVSEMFDIVFFITQINEVKDWSENIITINKENNISKIKIK